MRVVVAKASSEYCSGSETTLIACRGAIPECAAGYRGGNISPLFSQRGSQPGSAPFNAFVAKDYSCPACFFSTFAQVSFSATVRLKIGAPGLESRSAQKYPRRSN